MSRLFYKCVFILLPRVWVLCCSGAQGLCSTTALQSLFVSVWRKQIVNWKSWTLSQSLTKSRKEELPGWSEEINPHAQVLHMHSARSQLSIKDNSHHDHWTKARHVGTSHKEGTAHVNRKQTWQRHNNWKLTCWNRYPCPNHTEDFCLCGCFICVKTGSRVAQTGLRLPYSGRGPWISDPPASSSSQGLGLQSWITTPSLLWC